MTGHSFLKSFATVLIVLYSGFFVSGQNITGKVSGQDKTIIPLAGANVRWIGSRDGVSTNSNGFFSIPRDSGEQRLVISFVGYNSDTISVSGSFPLTVLLHQEVVLNEVKISSNAGAFDRHSIQTTEIIDTRTLQKAACCNLSESFETNASVTVAFNDAVTGAKHIQMLGLSGNYVQTNTENIPFVRGLAGTFGLQYIPGTWIQSIDLNKGVGSVVNGYEAMTGQINVELRKPDDVEKLHLNTYFNHFGRAEINLNLSTKLSDKWSTGLLSHASTLRNRVDDNGDGFLDMPLYTQLNGLNRWKYQSEKLMAQFGVHILNENRTGGQVNYRPETRHTWRHYGFGSNTRRYSAFAKIARLYPHKPYQGLGLIVNASLFDQNAYFGQVDYDSRQKNLYGNLIYQNILGNSNHTIRTGLSYVLDHYHEVYAGMLRTRKESVPGAFFEYTYNHLDRMALVLGSRADVHNLYGFQWIPRMHFKFDIDNRTALRIAAGKGFRVPNPLAENLGNLISSRIVVFREELKPEVSWNYGLSLNRDFTISGVKANLSADFFRTHFENQLIADLESHRYLYFYNLNGKAFANSFHTELNVIPAKRWDIKLAYRLFDNRQTITDESGEQQLLPKMMVSRDRVLFNAGYALPYDKWKFDLTVQWNGKQRLSMAALKPESGHLHHVERGNFKTPTFYTVNAQITRTFRQWDIYVGGENLTGFRQAIPIMGAENPFYSNFDAGMAWGPVVGRMFYTGLRFKIGD